MTTSPNEVDLEDEEEDEYGEASGREVMMRAVQRCEDTAEQHAFDLFTTRPQDASWTEEIFIDLNKGTVNPVYVVVAALRTIHALLVVPPPPPAPEEGLQPDGEETCAWLETIKELRDPRVVKQLLSVIEDLHCLPCHIAAKFLRVMSIVLDARLQPRALDQPRLELYSLLAMYVGRITELLVPIIKLAKDKKLDPREETLCAELAHFAAVVVEGVPLCRRFSGAGAAFREGITMSIEWLVPHTTIRLFIGMALYELQVESGEATGGNVDRTFVKHAYKKAGMKENAMRLLTQYLVRCPENKYDVLEVFTVADVFNGMVVRPSFMSELLSQVDMIAYSVFVEELIQGGKLGPKLGDTKGSSTAINENLLHLATVEVVPEGRAPQRGSVLNLLCATTERLYLLAPSDQPQLYRKEDNSGRWEPSREAAHPREPSFVWGKEYSQIACIYRCYGTQMLAIEWKSKEKKDASGRWAATPGTSSYHVFVCHRARDREVFVNILQSYSAMSRQDRVSVINDPGIREEVLRKAGESKVLMATFATQIGDDRPRLYVLTMKEVFEFSVNLGNWKVPHDSDVFIDHDDFQLGGDNEDDEDAEVQGASGTASGTAATTPGGGGEVQGGNDHLRKHMERLGTVQTRPPSSPSKAETSVLSVNGNWNLSPTEIHFETGPEADLTLHTGGVIKIHFHDDTTRELWRRALAFYLTESGAASWGRAA